MDAKEYIQFKHQYILPFLQKNLNKRERLQLLNYPGILSALVELSTQNTIPEYLAQRNFEKYLVEDQTMGVADRSWAIEALLGLKSAAIQKSMNNESWDEIGENTWCGVNSDALGTPMGYLSTIFSQASLRPGHRVIDLGSGFGNVGHYLGLARPDCQGLGLEFVYDRWSESEHVRKFFEFKNVNFMLQDLTSKHFHLPLGDIYFSYDSLSISTYEKLRHYFIRNSIEKEFTFIYVEGKTPLLDQLCREPWLKPLKLIELADPYRRVAILKSQHIDV
ncbi:MAG: hypothetical protein HOM21_07100 [Halobacteriovoraceae bacterium]|nr:hypothetical protein [Halobacteriovoraceae bacterium]